MSIFVFGVAYGKVAQPPLPLEAANEPAQPPMPMVYDEPQLDQPPPLTLDAPIEHHPQFKASNATVRYVVRDEDGNYRIDDILVDEETFKRNFGTDEENAKLDRQGLPKGINEWPNKELPYVISSEFSYANRQKIKSAIQNFNNVFAGCFKIRSIMPWDKNWVNVRPVSGDGCSAPIGNQGRGAHDLKLNPYCCDCLEEYTIQHEFIHAIGFFHVQS